MKRFTVFISGLLAFLTFASLSVSAIHTGIAEKSDDEKLQVVRMLEIMNGDENGDLHLTSPVTRAEFVKMAICASSYKDQTGKSSSVSIFPDVTSEHWAVGYVSTAVKAGLVSGYLDGTFKPNNQVKLEEAVIILLKLLGYTNADFQGTYPEAQLDKYAEIDLDTDISAKRGDALTRYDCMKLIYNALCTKNKQGQYYCTTLGYMTDSEDTVDYLALLEDNMTGPFINNNSSYLSKIGFPLDSRTEIYRDGKLTDKENVSEYDVYYYCDKLRTVWFYSDKAFGKIDAVSPNRETPSTIVFGQTAYRLSTPEAAKKVSNIGSISKDDYVMVMLDKNGNAADVVLADSEMYNRYKDEDADLLTEVNKTISDPIVVKDLSAYKSEIPFDLGSASILYDSEEISPSDIEINDVLYYSEPFNTVWVFRDTKSGICRAISPSREAPSAVTVGNATYVLSTDDIIYKFSNYGTFKTDMLVTLLLGKDGNAVDVIEAGTDIIGDGEDKVSYASIVSDTIKGPYISTGDGGGLSEVTFDLGKATIYKNNEEIDRSGIRKYDVYYYSKLLGTVWLYDDTAVGTIEAINPSRVSPSSVTVSGKTYAVETDSARFAVSSLGTYKVGDKVTLLLGKDGNVAGIEKIGVADTTVYGLLIGTGKKQFVDSDGKAYTADYATVYSTSGDTYTYECKASSYSTGDAVKINVTEDKVQISKLSGPGSASGAASLNNALEKGLFAADAQIIEYFNEEIYGTVLPSRITGRSIDKSYIKYFLLDENGYVKKLILNNYTGDLVEYGILTQVNGSTYKYIIGDTEQTYSSGQSKFTVRTGAAYFAFSAGRISKIGNIGGDVSISMVSDEYAYTDKNKSYPLDENVKVFILSGGAYKSADLSDLKKGDYTMTGYYDKEESSGGRIRVIVAY